MVRKHLNFAASLIVAMLSAAILVSPADAAVKSTTFACSEQQKEEIRAWIKETCGGSGSAVVYCSFLGLWEIRGYTCGWRDVAPAS